MTRGRKADPKRARRDTGHRAKPGELRKPAAKARTRGPVSIVPTRMPAPEDMPAGAREVWDALIDDLTPELRRPSDLEAFRMLCIAARRSRQSTESIESIGLLVTGERGPMVNPLTRLERDSMTAFFRGAEQLGLTMAARMRLGLVLAQGATMMQQLEQDLGKRE